MPDPDRRPPSRTYIPYGHRVVALLRGEDVVAAERRVLVLSELTAYSGKQSDTREEEIVLHRLVQSVSTEYLAETHRRVYDSARASGSRVLFVPNLFVTYASTAKEARALAARLQELDDIELAYVAPNLSRPPSDHCADGATVIDLTGDEPHREPTDVGVGARLVTSLPGGTGAGVGFADLERSWNLVSGEVAHCDLPTGIKLIFGTPETPPNHTEHGMSTLGIVLATQGSNAGTDGIATDASPRVVATTSGIGHTTFSETQLPGFTGTLPTDPNAYPDIWNPLAAAIRHLYDNAPRVAPDDLICGVILIEEQVSLTILLDAGDEISANGPVETDPAVASLIAYATALGIAVIEPTGDTGIDLQIIEDSLGVSLVDPALPPMRSRSGALLVSALDRNTPTNRSYGFGRNVAFYAQGAPNISSLGYSVAAPTSATSGSFNATSLASSIVAGAVVVARAMALTVPGGPRTVAEIRDLLINTGTPAPAGAPAIGVMPNLAAVAAGLGVQAPVYARDNASDGGAPHSGLIGTSLDLFAFRLPISPTHVADYETGSRKNSSPSASARPERATHVYVRAFNSSAVAQDVLASVWMIPAGKEGSPNDWVSLGPPLSRSGLPAGSGPWLLGPLDWTAPTSLAGTSVKVVAVLSTPTTAEPSRAGITDTASFEDWVRRSPTVTLRRISVQSS